VTRQITPVLGNSQKLDGGSMYGNCPRAVWERWSAPDEQGRIDLACRTMLVQEPGRLVLFEAGIGAFMDPKQSERFGVVESEHMLLRNLEALGFADSDIDVVILSHLHFDHAGGLLAAYEEDAEARLLFPNARFVVGHDAFERARHPHARDRASFIPTLPALLAGSGRLEIVQGERSGVLGPDYHFHRSQGHTPGLLLTEVAQDDDGPVVFVSDLIPGRPWMHAPITMGYDRYPELLVDEKIQLLERLVACDGAVFFTHDPEVAQAKVRRDEKGRFHAA
jgi:glyoxylase-like metal-dependent hydrolase (beta-lactamase superfamily II)